MLVERRDSDPRPLPPKATLCQAELARSLPLGDVPSTPRMSAASGSLPESSSRGHCRRSAR